MTSQTGYETELADGRREITAFGSSTQPRMKIKIRFP
jgi:hypothetical protein